MLERLFVLLKGCVVYIPADDTEKCSQFEALITRMKFAFAVQKTPSASQTMYKIQKFLFEKLFPSSKVLCEVQSRILPDIVFETNDGAFSGFIYSI